MISPDRVILDMDDPDWTTAHGIARDFRSCTKTVAVGPTLFAAHGPSALQSFQELQLKIIVNVCLCTAMPRMLSTLCQFLVAPGVIAVSVMASKDTARLKAVVALAEHARVFTKRVEAPAILAYVTSRASGLKQRHRDIKTLLTRCHTAGLAGVIVASSDIPFVRSVVESRLMVFSMSYQPPRDYRQCVPANVAERPGITELLDIGVDHVLLGSDLIPRADVEWSADMAVKELALWVKVSKAADICA